MQREGILERVGEQEEADLLKEAHVRAVFAASDCPVSKEQIATSGASARASSTTRSGSLRGGLSWSW